MARNLLSVSRRLSSVLAIALFAGVLLQPTSASAFIRGDVDGGGSVDIGDAIAILNSLFVPGNPPVPCADAADTNDDGSVNVADGIFLLSALFVSGATPIPPPFPLDGVDPTPDALAPCGGLGILPFSTIAQGPDSGIMTPVETVITDASAWSNFWMQHSTDPVPVVDFNTEMVIAILGIATNFGISHTINEIEVTPAGLEIRYTTLLPGVYLPDDIEPHHFVSCPRSFETPIWMQTVIALP